MSKQSGLGDNLYLGGYNLSGDIGALGRVATPRGVLDVTGIDKSAMERVQGLGDGAMEYTAFFNDATGQSHPVHKALPTADVHAMYCRGTSIGSPAAAMVAKQVNYDPTRGADGSLTFGVQCLANAYGLDWCRLLTAGLRTDTGATNGTGYDTGASLSLGAQAYLQVTAFTGTDVTIKIQDSADNASFADVADLAFTAVTAAPATQRLATGTTATIRRYVRAVTSTSGGFTSATFAVAIAKNTAALG